MALFYRTNTTRRIENSVLPVLGNISNTSVNYRFLRSSNRSKYDRRKRIISVNVGRLVRIGYRQTPDLLVKIGFRLKPD